MVLKRKKEKKNLAFPLKWLPDLKEFRFWKMVNQFKVQTPYLDLFLLPNRPSHPLLRWHQSAGGVHRLLGSHWPPMRGRVTSHAEPGNPALVSTELHLSLSGLDALMAPLLGLRNLATAQMVLSLPLILTSSLCWLTGPINTAVSPHLAWSNFSDTTKFYGMRWTWPDPPGPCLDGKEFGFYPKCNGKPQQGVRRWWM